MKSMVLAIGGNALIHQWEKGTTREQRENTRRVARQVARLASRGYRIVLTHGNGPQVGAELLLSERAAGVVPVRSLDLCDASTQGEMGYLLQQALKSELRWAGLHLPVVTVVTQCLVSLDDPAMSRPSKPVGRFYSEAEAEECRRRLGWTIAMDAERGYRRVVPSPQPTEIIEFDLIERLFKFGALVIACGGGGIPVVWMNGELAGVEAVIDKDPSSSLLASQLGADLLVIGTDTDCVYVDYKKPAQRALHRIAAAELDRYLQAGQFAPGSMEPKVASVLQFLRGGGTEAIIASCDDLCGAVEGAKGTHVFLGQAGMDGTATAEFEAAKR
jgi:carbamate kinase